jgi:hypothetical protein
LCSTFDICTWQTPSNKPWPSRYGLLRLDHEESPMLRKTIQRQCIDVSNRDKADPDALGF